MADAVTIAAVDDAPWLPPGGRAEVVRGGGPAAPMSMVRLLLRRGGAVFCVPRDETGKLDLPSALVGPDDPSGLSAIAELAGRVTGRCSRTAFVGMVRNRVASDAPGYPWPVPLAHFGVWTTTAAPVVDGTWLGLGAGSPLRERHWAPLVTSD